MAMVPPISLEEISARETKAVYNNQSKRQIISANQQDLCKIKIRIKIRDSEVEKVSEEASWLKTQHLRKTRKKRVSRDSLKNKISSSKESQCKGNNINQALEELLKVVVS